MGSSTTCVAELPLHADHAFARAGLHRHINGFARLEQRRDARDAAILVERSADLNVGQLQRAGARDGDDNRQDRQRTADRQAFCAVSAICGHHFFSSAMRASRPFIAVAASALQP